MENKDGKKISEIAALPIKNNKPKKRKIEKTIEEKSTEDKLLEDKITEDKPLIIKESKTQIQITGQPPTEEQKPTDDFIIDFEITDEMIEYSLKGILETVHTIAPKRFNNPTEQHIKALSPPTTIVIKRWVKKIDMLKYLPEMTLAACLISVINDMKVKENHE